MKTTEDEIPQKILNGNDEGLSTYPDLDVRVSLLFPEQFLLYLFIDIFFNPFLIPRPG
jgi:hypothetical protein